MREIIKQWKKYNYSFVYKQLNDINFEYTLDNLVKYFSSISSQNKYCYLIYLLSKEDIPQNTLLICNFLLFSDTFFYDIHPVVYMFLQKSLLSHPYDKTILEWIIDTYENHPDSPFSYDEIRIYKSMINTNR